MQIDNNAKKKGKQTVMQKKREINNNRKNGNK